MSDMVHVSLWNNKKVFNIGHVQIETYKKKQILCGFTD